MRNVRLLSIAEETVTEFVSKATGTAIDWIQLPGMKVSELWEIFLKWYLCFLIGFN